MTELSSPRPRLAVPRIWPIQPRDLIATVAANALLIVGMWVRHGGLNDLGSLAAQVTAAGQLTALLGTYAALIQITLMSRSPFLDQLFGMDRLANWHRWLGFAVLWLLIGHTVFSTVGYSLGDGSSVVSEAWTLLTTYPYVLMATVSLGLFILVAATSIRAARRNLSYETWYFIHLYAYLAVALSFMHQLVIGTDFANDPIARLYWIGLYVVVIALIVVFRIGHPIALALRHRLRVANVVSEGSGIISIYITGRQLDRLPVRAGQFFLWRFLAGDGWWRAHPFSISAAPNGQFLRLTVKNAGDDTRLMRHLRPGTRVIAEGPYGAFTDLRRTRAKVLLIAGGIGVAPIRALLEALPAAPGAITLLYRAGSWDEAVFRDELDALARLRGATIHYLIGRRRTRDLPHDPLEIGGIRRLVPDVAERDVYICGPIGMIDTLRRRLRTMGVPAEQIHAERFAF